MDVLWSYMCVIIVISNHIHGFVTSNNVKQELNAQCIKALSLATQITLNLLRLQLNSNKGLKNFVLDLTVIIRSRIFLLLKCF